MDFSAMIHKFRQRLSLWQPPKWLEQISAPILQLRNDIVATKLLAYASGMSYMTLGSIVPSLAAVFAIVSAFQSLADPQAGWFITFQNFIIHNLAPESSEQTLNYLKEFLANLDVTKIGATGFAFLFVIVIMLLRNIEVALNDIWQVPSTRSLFKRFLFFWSTITLGALILSVVVAVISKYNFASLLPFGVSEQSTPKNTGSLVSTLTGGSLTFLFFALLYKLGPNCKVSMKAAVTGALVATIMIRLAAWVYGHYIATSDWNQNIYGALAAVPLFLLWLYIAWVVILLGALFAWRVQHGFAIPRGSSSNAENLIREPLTLARNRQLQALMPLYCVTAVNWYFRESAKGVKGLEIARELDLPPSWVKEGIRVASKLGLIVVGQDADAVLTSDQIDQDILDMPLFPTHPPEKLTMGELSCLLSEKARQWLQARRINLPYNLTQITQLALASIEAGESEKTLAQFLDTLKLSEKSKHLGISG